MFALHTDLYQLTMAAGYHAAGKQNEVATFELFVRRMPPNRDILVFAGLAQALEYLNELRFVAEDIEYLRGLPNFRNATPEFFGYLEQFCFTGDVHAMPEGTPFFPNEPVLRVRAPLIEAQIAETYLLSVLSFQTLIASKAARVVRAAQGRPVVEFGTRRAHSPEAGVLAARAAYIAGCAGSSNVEAGFRYGVPVFGTSAHSWVQAFDDETESFRHLQRLLGEGTVYLIDTWDTVRGAQRAASLGRPIAAVRIDSGNMAALAREVRQVLDAAGLHDAKIMLSGDLNEDNVADLVLAGVPADVFGVGTELATSSDAPNLSAVYKMVEIERDGRVRYTAKSSAGKATLPGAKQVYRTAERDLVAGVDETADGTPLLQPVMRSGSQLDLLPEAAESRERCVRELVAVPPGRPVEFSNRLRELAETLRRNS